MTGLSRGSMSLVPLCAALLVSGVIAIRSALFSTEAAFWRLEAANTAWTALSAYELGDASTEPESTRLRIRVTEHRWPVSGALIRLTVSISDDNGREVLTYECIVPKRQHDDCGPG